MKKRSLPTRHLLKNQATVKYQAYVWVCAACFEAT